MHWIAAAWAAVILLIVAIGSPSAISVAAQATYLLLALYGLQLLTHETSQPSLGHAAFLAVGAYTTAALHLHLGLDGLTSAVVASLIAGAAGWVLGWGATRLSPSILALMTWALGWLVYVSLGAFPELTGGVAGISLHAPMALQVDLLGVHTRFNAIGHLLLGSFLLATFLLLYRSAQRSVLGRAWAALRDSTSLASSLGYDVPSIRRWTFAVAAGVAGLAGSLGAQLMQLVDPSLYSPLQSLNLFVAILIGAPLGFFGPIAGALVTSGVPFAVEQAFQGLGMPLGSGRELTAAALVIVALGVSVTLGRRRDGGNSAVMAPVPQLPSDETTPRPSARDGTPILEASGITVDFDGLRALDAAEIRLHPGEIHGLIGPNGSGKSTLLRCLSGTIQASQGTVKLAGEPMGGLEEARRVRAGIARTFQRTAVMPHLRVAEHVEVGLRLRRRHANLVQALLKTPAYRIEAAAVRKAALWLLEAFGLESYARDYPDTLSGGRQRLLQMATAAATGPDVLLLDEPSAGMSPDEIRLLHRALRALAPMGLTILLSEHNMRFLADVASDVTVLEEGRVVATGTPEEIARDPVVQKAYLGSRQTSDETKTTRRSSTRNRKGR